MAATPSTRPPRPRGDIGFAVFLAFLALLALLLWLADPNHFPTGASRGEWPPPASK